MYIFIFIHIFICDVMGHSEIKYVTSCFMWCFFLFALTSLSSHCVEIIHNKIKVDDKRD